ncbi:MAG TPA: zinc-ribbon domain containing protein [Clostridia bacterium]|nr:zinc-ribbon domain containing protein [Clostridia bacterium]
MYSDKSLKCKDCGANFIFTAGEQEFYAEKGLMNEPSRCKECRNARKGARREGRTMYKAICSECGAETEVPFSPKPDRPVYCDACFAAKR